ncbi:hypothetical protein [Streptomyces sp. NPDC005438]|uniref:hypothetical protein n=1 Tax=Streptomyces sp. NPDC005438 TaxID=3156880 RepID=UPI0033AC452F
MTEPPPTLSTATPAPRAQPGLWRGLSGRVARLLRWGLTALPLTVASVVAALLGRPDRGAEAQRRLARRNLPPGVEPPTPSGTPTSAGPVVRLGSLMLVPALVAFFVAVVILMTCYSGYLYFARPDTVGALGHPFTADSLLDNAWGGPTLVGAWLTHSLVALGLHLVGLVVLGVLGLAHRRTTYRMLGG